MKKIYPQLSVLLSASFSIILLFTFSKSALSQDFITEWTFTEDASFISFNALSTGEVNYTWTTRPSNLIGEGTFNSLSAGRVTIENINIEEGDTLTLNIAPEHLKRFYMDFYTSREELKKVIQWGEVIWSSMEDAFYKCSFMVVSANDTPNLSQVESLEAMFRGADLFNQDISNWDVSNIKNMKSLFDAALTFNQDISSWNTSNVTNMASMFKRALVFNQDISSWNTENVTNMASMFFGAEKFNQNIGEWDVSNVTDMNSMLGFAQSFNQDISNWDVSNVTDMNSMFSATSKFNYYIGNWDVSNVTDMSFMFSWNQYYNKSLSQWNTANVTDMSFMFHSAETFNQNLGSWDVSNVNNMTKMFYDAKSFNHDIGAWNTTQVKDMTYMFENSVLFNQDISKWTYHDEVNMEGMLDLSGLDCENYSKAITAWRDNPALENKTIGVEGLEYGSNKEEDRNYLIEEKGWNFIGDEKSEEECDVTVSSNGLSIAGNNIVLYPNPTYHSITIEAEAKDLKGLSIINANGQDVSGLVTIQRSGNKANIDLSRLSPGIYVLRTLSNTTKVVKM